MYFYEEGECILNTESAISQPDDFMKLEDDDKVIFFHNGCLDQNSSSINENNDDVVENTNEQIQSEKKQQKSDKSNIFLNLNIKKKSDIF